jgi:hypothetical protein
MLSSSPWLAWFFASVLMALAVRAAARLALARASGGLPAGVRNAEAAHAAMGFGMAALLAPGLPRPPTAASLCFFAALTAFAAFTWVGRVGARLRGRTTNCGCAPKDSTHLLDPHHAIVGAAMIVMLLQPGMGNRIGAGIGAGAGIGSGGAGAGTGSGTGISADALTAMPGMMTQTTGAPSVAILLFLAYVWLSALVLGYGMTRVLPAVAGPTLADGVGRLGGAEVNANANANARLPQTDDVGMSARARKVAGLARAVAGGDSSMALLGSPATVYGCELAMTVLTGLMLLS